MITSLLSSKFHLTLLSIAVGISALGTHALWAQDQGVELSSLASPEKEVTEERTYGPFTGVYFGSMDLESAKFVFDDLNYRLDGSEDNFLMGFEIGYAWRTKYLLEFALSFEGMYGSAALEATIADDNGVVAGNRLGSSFADLNAATFFLNFQMALDLQRLKPCIGPVYRFRPYVGLGVGGSQVWYRNQRSLSVSELGGGAVALAGPSLYEIDEFVFANHFNVGVEFRISKHFDLYLEYRRLILDSLSDAADIETGSVIAGFQYRY